jgi:hypothetical protein
VRWGARIIWGARLVGTLAYDLRGRPGADICWIDGAALDPRRSPAPGAGRGHSGRARMQARAWQAGRCRAAVGVAVLHCRSSRTQQWSTTHRQKPPESHLRPCRTATAGLKILSGSAGGCSTSWKTPQHTSPAALAQMRLEQVSWQAGGLRSARKVWASKAGSCAAC